MNAHDHATALKALLTAILPAQAEVLEYDAVEARAKAESLPKRFVIVEVSRRFGDEGRLVARNSVSGWRLNVHAVGDTVQGARLLHALVTDALEGAHVAIAGRTSTPIQFETEDSVAPDDGWFSGLTNWTYSI